MRIVDALRAGSDKGLTGENGEAKSVFVCLAIGLVQITPLNAQAVSPAGHYAKKSGGAGEMRVEPTAEGWRVLVTAGGIPRGGATAADCNADRRRGTQKQYP